MGFRHEPRTYKLVFEDPAMHGLEVKARSLSVDELNDNDVSLPVSFGQALVSWNLEDVNGHPVPATVAAVTAYPDVAFITKLSTVWLKAVTGPDEELGKGSDAGGQSLAGSIQMVPALPSQAS